MRKDFQKESSKIRMLLQVILGIIILALGSIALFQELEAAFISSMLGFLVVVFWNPFQNFILKYKKFKITKEGVELERAEKAAEKASKKILIPEDQRLKFTATFLESYFTLSERETKLKDDMLNLVNDLFPCFDDNYIFSFSHIFRDASQNRDLEQAKKDLLDHSAQYMYVINNWFYFFSQKQSTAQGLKDTIEQLVSILRSTESIIKKVKQEIENLPEREAKYYLKLKGKYDHWIERFETFLRQASDLLHEDFTKISFEPLPKF